MRRLLVAFGLLAITAPLWAQVSKTFTWANPTQYVNGGALPGTDIRETRISVSATSGGAAQFVEVSAGSAQTVTSLPVYTAGTWFARAQTVTTAGGVSAFSNEASFVVGVCEAAPSGCLPRPPTNLQVQ